MEHKLENKQIIFQTDSPSFLLWQLNTIWQNIKKEAINEVANLSLLQYGILINLVYLTKDSTEVSQIQLASHLGMEQMNISQALKILEREKYIFRQPHSKDTRAKAVSLTTKGNEITAKIQVNITKAELDFFYSKQDNAEVFIQEMKKLIARI